MAIQAHKMEIMEEPTLPLAKKNSQLFKFHYVVVP